jgi:hypothetical protein
VTIGERALKEGNVEIKLRTQKEALKVKKDEAVNKVIENVQTARQR